MADVIAAAVANAPVPYPGRWGFHQVSHEQYLLVKQNHKTLFKALRQTANLCRMARKTVYQQKINGASLVLKALGIRPTAYHTGAVAIQPTMKSLYKDYLAYYQAIRRPYPTIDALNANRATLSLTGAEKDLLKSLIDAQQRTNERINTRINELEATDNEGKAFVADELKKQL